MTGGKFAAFNCLFMYQNVLLFGIADQFNYKTVIIPWKRVAKKFDNLLLNMSNKCININYSMRHYSILWLNCEEIG